MKDAMDCYKAFSRPRWQHDASSSSRLFPGIKGLLLIFVQFPALMQCERKALPARDGVANTLFLYPRKHLLIVIGLTTPATLDPLKWHRNMLNVLGMLKHECATLKED